MKNIHDKIKDALQFMEDDYGRCHTFQLVRSDVRERARNEVGKAVRQTVCFNVVGAVRRVEAVKEVRRTLDQFRKEGTTHFSADWVKNVLFKFPLPRGLDAT